MEHVINGKAKLWQKNIYVWSWWNRSGILSNKKNLYLDHSSRKRCSKFATDSVIKIESVHSTHVYIYSQSIVHFNIFNFICLAICSFPFSLSPFFLLKQIANPILLANSAFARLVVVHHSPCIFSWTFYSIDFPASFPRFSRHRCSFKPAFHGPSQLPRTTIGPKSFHVSCKTRKLAG